MANAELVQLVQRERWNKWRAEHPDKKLDLSNADLSGADLKWADLRKANLRGADLSGANLREADLSWANLQEACLSAADLSGANLSWASLREADLSGANFSKADLGEANLTKTRLSETNFGAACLRNALGLAECNFQGPCILDIRAIQQSGVLPLSFLRGCGLPDAFIEYLPSLVHEAIQLFSCCISYSQTDKSFAKRLFDTLQGRNIRCWLDEKRMLRASGILDQGPVDRGLRIWDKILLCCSKDTLSSAWVDDEIDAAFEKEEQLTNERGRQTIVLIPLDLDGHLRGEKLQSSKARLLRSRMVADFRGWNRSHDRFESEVKRIALALRVDGGPRPTTAKPKTLKMHA